MLKWLKLSTKYLYLNIMIIRLDGHLSAWISTRDLSFSVSPAESRHYKVSDVNVSTNIIEFIAYHL